MRSNRPVLLWSSIAVFLGVLLWLIDLAAARVVGGSGDSLRLLLVAVTTNLSIVGAFFFLAALSRRVGPIKDLTHHSPSARATAAIVGILSALVGYITGHLLIVALWGSHPPLSIDRALYLNLTIVPVVLSVLLVLSTFIGLSVRSVRSPNVRKGIVFTLTFIPAMLIVTPMMFDEISIYASALWQSTMMSYRGPIETPDNEFTTVFVEEDVVDAGHLPEVVTALAAYQPEDLVVLVQGTPGTRDGVYCVSWHGIEPIVMAPPAGVDLAIGFTGYVPTELQIIPPESLRSAIRVNPFRLQLGADRLFVLYAQNLQDMGEDILTYLFRRAGVTSRSDSSLDRHVINVHQSRIERWGKPGGFDAMRVGTQTSGRSWTIEYDPQSRESRAIYSYVYDRDRRTVTAADESPHPSLTRLKGRRVIIDALPQSEPYYGNHVAICLATEVVNARHGIGFRFVPGWVYAALLVVFQVLTFFLFLRFRAVAALWTLVLAHAALAVVMLGAFVEANVLVSPVAFWASSALVGGVLFITGFLREQREAVEQRTRLETELNTARQMQLGLMPTSDPQVPGFDIAGLCRPANEVGGDFYAYLHLDKKDARVGIAVADVSGKAMKAAMTALMTSGMLYEAAERSGSPSDILEAINTPLHARSDKRVFTAMVMASLEAKGKRRTLTISNAGQTPPLLVRDGKVTPLKIEGVRLPLGLKPDVKYPKRKQSLKFGDLVFFLTDGLTEATSKDGVQYGEERLYAYLLRHAVERSRALVDGVLSDVQAFTGEGPLSDDLTVVAVKVENS